MAYFYLLKNKIRLVLPGIILSVITGLAALFLSNHYGAPAMLFALLLGIGMSFLYQDSKCKPGIEFTASQILRFGVALLGLRIAFDDLVALGWQSALLLIFAIFSTIIFGVVLSRAFGLSQRFGALTGGSVAICGASAAMAISAVLPNSEHKERDTLLTIIGVTSLSTIAMVAYPILADYLQLNPTDTGIFIGGTIHDVAQVVGAGYSISQETGDIATLTKLVRVAYLMPVVLCFLLVLKMRKKNMSENGKAPGIPGFLIAFVLLMILNSVVPLPELVTTTATEISRFALVISIAAIGMKSNLQQLTQVGIKPIILMIAETGWIAMVILGWLMLS